MSAFASKGFNANAYLALRPTYNKALLDWLLEYHVGQRTYAADIACGPGTFTTDIAKRFNSVVGVDPSPSMIESATRDASTRGLSNIEYMMGSGEKLPLEAGSVDMLTVMQGVHWFRIQEFLAESLRVLRPDGTLAMVGYGYPQISNWPDEMGGLGFSQKLATDRFMLEPYWDKGFRLIDDMYAPLLSEMQTNGCFKDIRHVGFPTAASAAANNIAILPETWIDSKAMSFDAFRAYLKTWSAYKAWKDAHPEDRDIIDAYFDKHQQEFGISGDNNVTVTWPLFAIVARKSL
ncbi:trans-aconitate methyltransferase 1 [Coemansia sp. RSA 486]|nr:trans-aconitate methyltransferase 1 [Coemansia sp. RSA 486]KAJ2220695.1 trans-aconitate methyltransferase 1 [Coemansia sp. RSA 485]KAJ2601465.1 trans-aconitate methyltransferase 1 [Coemansia sp. RSA 1721]KAJ2638727.1 trans-aconitate methyltransferase 1 [Coemansia sp. RSA 1286]